MFLNGFSMGNVWGIFEVAYLPAGCSYLSAFVASPLGFGGLDDDIIFCRKAFLPEFIKEIATAKSTHPYYIENIRQ